MRGRPRQFDPLVCGGVHCGCASGTTTTTGSATGAGAAVVATGAAVAGGVAGDGALGAVTVVVSAPGSGCGAWFPPVGAASEARTSAMRSAEVSPSVALMAAPVARIRAERAGWRSRRRRSVIVVLASLVVVAAVVVVIVVVIPVTATVAAVAPRGTRTSPCSAGRLAHH